MGPKIEAAIEFRGSAAARSASSPARSMWRPPSAARPARTSWRHDSHQRAHSDVRSAPIACSIPAVSKSLDGRRHRVRAQRARRWTRTRWICQGRLLMPALINCHTHLYSTLARGMHLPGPPPADFPAILKKLWWRLDRALNEDDVYYSALARPDRFGQVRCGHGDRSPLQPQRLRRQPGLDRAAFREVGLRGATCYETSDRNGKRGAQEAIRENVRFLERTRPGALVGGMFGLHAAFTLSDRTLRRLRGGEPVARRGIPRPRGRRSAATVRRSAGCATRACSMKGRWPPTASMSARRNGRRWRAAASTWSTIHNRTATTRSASPTCRPCSAAEFAWDWAPTATRRACGTNSRRPIICRRCARGDPRGAGAEAYAAAFLNNREIVQARSGEWRSAASKPARSADLMLVDYFPPTPLDSDNLFGHLLFGISNAPVRFADGERALGGARRALRQPWMKTSIAERAAACAKALWKRF